MEDKYIPRIINFDINWVAIKKACMNTIGKEGGSKEPTSEWKRTLLLCEHSPIRIGQIILKWDNIPYYVSGHIVRHTQGVEKFVSTSREDRTGVDRTERRQTDPVSLTLCMNIQAAINIAARRLCYQADPETVKYITGMWKAIKEYDEDIAWAMVPQCIRCCSCIEGFGKCKFFENFAKELTKEELIFIRERYNKYNEYREKVLKK